MIAFTQEIEFTYTNIEGIEQAYDKDTPYTVGAVVRIGSFTYKSLSDNNKDNYPLNNLNKFWMVWKESNAYALLDPYSNTVTSWVGDGIVEFPRDTKTALAMGNFDTDSVKVAYLDELGVVIEEEEYLFGNYLTVEDVYSYAYGEFLDSTYQTLFINFKRIGTTIRVTLLGDGEPTSCGFMFSGEYTDFGCTQKPIEITDTDPTKDRSSSASFLSVVDNIDVEYLYSKAKQMINKNVLFVIDETDEIFDNLIILGTLDSVKKTHTNSSKVTMSWDLKNKIKEY